MSPTLRWLLFCQLLLTDTLHCGAQTPPTREGNGSRTPSLEEEEQLATDPLPELGTPSGSKQQAEEDESSPEGVYRVQSARRVVTVLSGMLGSRLKPPSVQAASTAASLGCEDLAAPVSVDSPLALFPHKLLGLALVPVLVARGCRREAEALVLRLYYDFGVADTDELLLELEDLIEKSPPRTPLPGAKGGASGRRGEGMGEDEGHLQAVMFNIGQLAQPLEAENGTAPGGACWGWTRVKGTLLLGEGTGGDGVGELQEAMRECESLGPQCSGVSATNSSEGSGRYSTVLRRGSRIVPSADSESWVQDCGDSPEQGQEGEEEEGIGRRARRSSQTECTDQTEEKVYSVVEWIPAVSTLYNLGTAVYYAAVNCSDTAKERALMSAVDLGTDALMAMTGGTAGIAGYAFGAGMKTGVKAGIKYLLNNMKQGEDIVFNQDYWTAATIIQ
ncbi:uncharacterized protein apof [Amia ocellicauda]|uniref:uncharacterized protein apof n=1 Tax=Amia ocellicauda TaxID=2972642 RepID=UPI003464763E